MQEDESMKLRIRSCTGLLWSLHSFTIQPTTKDLLCVPSTVLGPGSSKADQLWGNKEEQPQMMPRFLVRHEC